MALPASYESLDGAALELARAGHRRNPYGAHVSPTHIRVDVVPVDRGTVPWTYGEPLDSQVWSHADPDVANTLAFLDIWWHGRAGTLRDGQVAVVARRIGGTQ